MKQLKKLFFSMGCKKDICRSRYHSLLTKSKDKEEKEWYYKEAR